MIKPGFFRSDSIAQLSLRARLTLIGLWTEADARGRGIAHARVLRGALWSLDDDVLSNDVEHDLRALMNTDHIQLYEVDGKRFYQVLRWDVHQSAAFRRGESHLPEPTPANICMLEHDEECRSVLELEVKESKVNAQTGLSTQPDPVEEDFDDLWKIYPRKRGRIRALAKYRKTRKDGASAYDLKLATQNFADAMKAEKRAQEVIMHAERFFGKGREWEEFLEPVKSESTRPKNNPAAWGAAPLDPSTIDYGEVVELPRFNLLQGPVTVVDDEPNEPVDLTTIEDD